MTRILLVEDDVSLAMGLEDDLKLEGYQVQVARDGEVATRRAAEEPFDLIVLDVMLPRKDGFEVCREVRRAGKPVPLTHMEFKLLATLIRHRGRVLSRDQLLNDAWGLDCLVTDRAVDTHIANLRKKVEPKPSHPRHLITVHGTGYRFDD